jgi:CubicO group peptidase (beta-lactamase class C family)
LLDDSALAAIDAHIQQMMQELNVPGVALGIVQEDEIAYLRGYGIADASGREVTPQTPFLLASLSKSFTALAIMQLVEAGQIDLDAPVQQYLPYFRAADASASARITVRQLLYHTSGLSEYTGAETLYSRDMSEDALENDVRRLSGVALASEPGEAFNYSNTNYTIAGLIVQTVSGQPYADYVQEHIFEPLDMRHTFMTMNLGDVRTDGMTDSFTQFFGRALPYAYPLSGAGVPAAGIISCAEDLTHYVIAHLNEGRYGDAQLISPEGLATLHQPGSQMDEINDYAMGWMVDPLYSDAVAEQFNRESPLAIEHDGAWVGFRTFIILVPEEDLGIIALTNTDDFARIHAAYNVAHGTALISTSMWQEDFMVAYGRQISAMVLLVQLVLLMVWFMLLLRWRRHPELRPRRRWVRVLLIVLPLLLDVFIVLLGVVLAPSWNETTLPWIIVSSPDLGLLMVGAVALALGWGALRTGLFVWTFARTRIVAT